MPQAADLVRMRGKLYAVYSHTRPMIEVLHLMGLTRPELLRTDLNYNDKSGVYLRRGAGNHPRIGYYAELLRTVLEDSAYMRSLTNDTALETGRFEDFCSHPKSRPYPFSVFSPLLERAGHLALVANSTI